MCVISEPVHVTRKAISEKLSKESHSDSREPKESSTPVQMTAWTNSERCWQNKAKRHGNWSDLYFLLL